MVLGSIWDGSGAAAGLGWLQRRSASGTLFSTPLVFGPTIEQEFQFCIEVKTFSQTSGGLNSMSFR